MNLHSSKALVGRIANISMAIMQLLILYSAILFYSNLADFAINFLIGNLFRFNQIIMMVNSKILSTEVRSYNHFD